MLEVWRGAIGTIANHGTGPFRIRLLDDLELLAAPGLEQFKQDFRRVMGECSEGNMLVKMGFQNTVEKCLDSLR